MAWKGRPRASREAIGLRHGFRSGLEAANAESLKKRGQPVIFEQVKIKYAVPCIEHTYTLDFELANGIMVETKGRFEPTDRAKHLFIKTQHPDLDIRFVFQRPNTPISKGSKTTYAMWCEKHRIQWAAKVIPDAWIQEPGPHGRPGNAGGARTILLSEEVKNDIIGPPRFAHSAVRAASRGASQVARPTAGSNRDRVPPDNRPRGRKPSAQAR